MKHILTASLLFFVFHSNAQKIVSKIPDSVHTAFVINLPKLIKTMPLKDMENYSFVQGMMNDVFEANQNTKLSNLGIDFKREALYFAGDYKNYSVSSMVIPLENNNKFVASMNISDEDKAKLLKEGIYYNEEKAYILQNGIYQLVELKINSSFLKEKADSIFVERGWEKPFFYWWEEDDDFSFLDDAHSPLEEWEDEEWEIEDWDMEIDWEENWEDETTLEIIENDWEEEDGFDSRLMHNQLKDSLKEQYQPVFWENWLSQSEKHSLIKNQPAFEKALNKGSDAVLYVHPSSMTSGGRNNLLSFNPFWDVSNEVLKRTHQIGYLNITKDGLDLNMETHGNQKIMEVVQAAGKNKYNKDLLNYIPSSAPGYLINSINGKSAYDKLKEVYLTKLDKSEEPEELLYAAFWTLLDDMLDTKSILDLFSANMFLSFNGMQDMKVNRIKFDYDEETFEYTEISEETIEKLPSITFGASTPKTFIIEKFLKAFSAFDDGVVTKEGNFYRMKNGPIDGIPFFIMLVGDIFILTNNEDLVKNYSQGYGKNAISSAEQKAILAQPLTYAKLDWDGLPEELMELSSSKSERDMLSSLKDKSGSFELTVPEIEKEYYTMKMNYRFHGKYKNGAYYMMEILSTLYDNVNETNY